MNFKFLMAAAFIFCNPLISMEMEVKKTQAQSFAQKLSSFQIPAWAKKYKYPIIIGTAATAVGAYFLYSYKTQTLEQKKEIARNKIDQFIVSQSFLKGTDIQFQRIINSTDPINFSCTYNGLYSEGKIIGIATECIFFDDKTIEHGKVIFN